MKSIKNIREFAEDNGLSRQVVEHRIKAGWLFGELNGVKVMYNPKYAQPVKMIKEYKQKMKEVK